MRKHCDEYSEDDFDSEPRDREANRLAGVKADELVLIVGFEVEKNDAGDEAQQVCQRRNHIGLRSLALTVHREFSSSSGTMNPGSVGQGLICSRTYWGSQSACAARALRQDEVLESRRMQAT